MTLTELDEIKARLLELEQEIQVLNSRNARVELDKSWEISINRRLAICVLTYVFCVIFFKITRVREYYLAAIVPVLGFILSQLSLNKLKLIWQNKKISDSICNLVMMLANFTYFYFII